MKNKPSYKKIKVGTRERTQKCWNACLACIGDPGFHPEYHIAFLGLLGVALVVPSTAVETHKNQQQKRQTYLQYTNYLVIGVIYMFLMLQILNMNLRKNCDLANGSRGWEERSRISRIIYNYPVF